MNPDTDTNRRHMEYVSLLELGDKELESKNYSNAEQFYCQAMQLFTGRTEILGRFGQLYQAQQRSEEANLCFRGVLPDAVNERYFDAAAQSLKVLDQAVARDCISRSACEPERFSLKAPIQHGAQTRIPGFSFKTTDCRGSFTTSLRQGQIWFDGFNTVAFDRRGNIVQQHTKGNEFLVRQVAADRQATRLSGRVCFLDARSSPIYYHWMLDVLPKLHIVHNCGIDLQSIDHFLVRARAPFQLQTLALLGVPEEKIVQLDEDKSLYCADELLLPYLKNDLGERLFIGLGLGLASWIPGFLQRELAGQATLPARANRRLFISRQDTGTRCIENEAEVMAVFERYGIETVTFSKLSVPEQARLMREAALVVGVHGAGFTNLAFCQKGTQVLELFGPYIVPCYWSLANIAGLDYHSFLCEEAAAKTADDVQQRRDQNILVDTTVLEQALDAMLTSEAEQAIA